jgi:aspartate ammonia-lyase
MYRIEKDSLGQKQIPSDALFGIHALRAKENFPFVAPFSAAWYKAIGITKLACYHTLRKFRDAAGEKYGLAIPVKLISPEILDALCGAAAEISEGKYYDQFIVPAIQGGAGTSINMNVNEIIANSALEKTGHKFGEYEYIDPVEDANRYQSTNDVIPTALTVAVMKLLIELEEHINRLRQKAEELEKNHRYKLRQGYTQMQDALPTSFGILFSTYNEALSRDWWRVSKCAERVKQVNLGGGAIGTGLSLPRFFIMGVVPELRSITGLPLAQNENLADATSNLDKWVEIHATLKAHAVNLEKMSSDLRLLASDISGAKILFIPGKQTGSSIMPGKTNPVIPEFIISAAHKIYSNDMLISSLSGQGTLELNAYLPVIGNAVLESIELLIACNKTLLDNLLRELELNEETAYKKLIASPSVSTALTPYIGYHKASEIATIMKTRKLDIFAANDILKAIDNKRLKTIFEPGNLLKLGFTLDDLNDGE